MNNIIYIRDLKNSPTDRRQYKSLTDLEFRGCEKQQELAKKAKLVACIFYSMFALYVLSDFLNSIMR